jgi:hypothetical protein
LFDAFEGYTEDWPGVFVPPEHKKREVNTVSIVEHLQKREKYSPDFKNIRRQENIPIFVYDEFRLRGFHNHLLSESKYLGFAVSASDIYTLKGHSQPILMENKHKNSTTRGKIKGEIYTVPPESLLIIDRMKFNGVLFKRYLRTFFLSDQSYKTKAGKKIPSIQAWVYMGIPDQWSGDHLGTHPMFSHQGMKDKKYFEYFPTSTRRVHPPRQFPRSPHGMFGFEEHVG